MEPIQVNNKIFTYVKLRDEGRQENHLYKSIDSYLKIGGERVSDEFFAQKTFAQLYKAAPKILSSGLFEGNFYFEEEMFKGKNFKELFQKDIETIGKITTENFNLFLEFLESYTVNQLQQTKQFSKHELEKYVDLPRLCRYMPDKKDVLENVLLCIAARLEDLPIVLAHGDLHAGNIFPQGIIDFEHSHYNLPIGVDQAMAVFKAELYPSEDQSVCRFSQLQRKQFIAKLDQIFTREGLSAFSSFSLDFFLLMFMWRTGQMSASSKSFAWRTQKLVELIDQYLANESTQLS